LVHLTDQSTSGALSGTATAFFLFDVGDAIDLAQVRSRTEATAPARFTAKLTSPSNVQYQQPPVVIDGASLQTSTPGFRCRLKAFDYGVVSVALTGALPDSWPALVAEGRTWHDNPETATMAEQICRAFVDRAAPAVSRPRSTYLSEDYVVFVLTEIASDPTAEALLAKHGPDIAQLLRAEQAPLSAQEREEVLRHRISYLANDLLIPTWSAAFIYDTESGAQGSLELLEYANSQLLEFRYYDQLLDTELGRIYSQVQNRGWGRPWRGRRYTRAAHNVHSLFIDVNELTDKAENALKIAGDVYFARVFALAAARLGLDQWKSNVREKLQTLDDIYRFAVEQTAMARGEFLEITIVAILVLELVLFFLGIMK
jgi:hypothetical protein